MKHYRVNKVVKPGGAILKRKDILANNDRQAIEAAAQSEDCPICEVFHEGKQVGAVL